jgi:hypothetical protein
VIYYLLDCDDESLWVDVELTVSEYDTIYSYSLAYSEGLSYVDGKYIYRVDVSDKALYSVDTFKVESTVAGMSSQTSHTYIVIIEKRFAFYDIVVEYVKDRVFMVNNNYDKNGNYEFVSYRWYVNDEFSGDKQTLLSGPSYRDKFNPEWQYRVELLTVDGMPLQTCPGVSSVTYNNVERLYPNPAPKAGDMYFASPLDIQEYHTAALYTIQGRKVWQKPTVEISGGFTVPGISGAYILLLQGETGSVRYKVIVN